MVGSNEIGIFIFIGVAILLPLVVVAFVLYQKNKSSVKKKEYGKKLFKVLFTVCLILGLASFIIGILLFSLLSDWLPALILVHTGIGMLLVSFIFKFMHSLIMLLKDILASLEKS